VKPRLAQQGLLPINKCGGEFGAYLRKQVEEYGRVIRESGIKAE
jgi:hypothetical protein